MIEPQDLLTSNRATELPCGDTWPPQPYLAGKGGQLEKTPAISVQLYAPGIF